MESLTPEQFLAEHNRLSPLNLQATNQLLLRFRDEKQSLFKTADWSLDKMRRPFIEWMATIQKDKTIRRNRPVSTGWVTFPRPTNEI